MTAKKNEKEITLESLEASGAVVKMSEHSSMDIKRIPSNVLALDLALGGGIPTNKIVEAFGPAGGGKSAIALMLAGKAQEYGKVVFIDIENTLDPIKAANSNINIDELMIAQPESTEDTFELIHKLVKVPGISLIVVDSVAAMVPLAEIHGDMTDSHMAVQARLMSQGLRKLNQIMTAENHGTIVLFINQIRDTMNIGFGAKTAPTGGKALKFYSSVRLNVARIGGWEVPANSKNIIGQEIQVKVEKNKFSPPFRTATFKLDYTTGVCNEATLADEALKSGFLVKSGAWYSVPGEADNIAQGEAQMIRYLREHTDLATDLREKVLAM